MQSREPSTPGNIDPERVRCVIDAICDESPAYREPRGDMRLDCAGFAKSVHAALGNTVSLPHFSSSPEFLRQIDLRPFEECAVGDIVFFRHRQLPRDSKRRARVFTHVGLKYSDKEIAHMTKKGLFVEPLDDVLKERIVVSRENIDDIVWSDERSAFVMRN